MIDFLLAVPGKITSVLNHINTNLSAVRTARIDNLDATTSSRAAAATALSTAVWSDALAAKINSGGIAGTVRSIQSGFINTSALNGAGQDLRYVDVTINSVTPGKCFVYQDKDNDAGLATSSGRVISATVLRLSAASGSGSIRGAWTVIEYF